MEHCGTISLKKWKLFVIKHSYKLLLTKQRNKHIFRTNPTTAIIERKEKIEGSFEVFFKYVVPSSDSPLEQ